MKASLIIISVIKQDFKQKGPVDQSVLFYLCIKYLISYDYRPSYIEYTYIADNKTAVCKV